MALVFEKALIKIILCSKELKKYIF